MPALSLEQLNRLLWSFAGTRVVTTAARAGILRRLADRPDTIERLAADLDLDPLATGKVVRALTALGLVEADGDRYRVVDALAPQFVEGPDDMTPYLDHHHRLYEAWGASLEPWLRGQPWQTRARNDEEVAAFGAAMRAVGSRVARQLARCLDLDGVRRMLDVGGGFGQFSRELCRVNSELRATVLDIPQVTERAARDLAGSELADRIEFSAGDYLSSDYGSGFDLVMFANVLHQEQPVDAAEMVRRGAAALAPGGRVAVVDFQIDEQRRQHVLGCLFAINMRSFGDTHTEPDIRAWLEAAGLSSVERTDLDAARWLIVGRA